jgi:hypothetical protein
MVGNIMDEEFLIINIPEKFQFCVIDKNSIAGVVLLQNKATKQCEILIKDAHSDTLARVFFEDNEEVVAQREYKIIVSQLIEDFDEAVEEINDYRNELIEENLEVLDG